MLYYVTVKPGFAKDSVEYSHSANELTVRTRKKAHDGEANSAVISLLSDYFKVAKSCVIIRKGATSRHKTVEIL